MNEMKQPQNVAKHEFCVKDRKNVTVSGVKEVLSFDEQTVRMLTVSGELMVDGEDLRVKTLDVDRGIVAVDGQISSLSYADDRVTERKSFWSRLVR